MEPVFPHCENVCGVIFGLANHLHVPITDNADGLSEHMREAFSFGRFSRVPSDNADDLIDFLEWFKTTDAGSHKPIINGIDSEYGEEFYNVIRKFFEVNKGKDLLVNFS